MATQAESHRLSLAALAAGALPGGRVALPLFACFSSSGIVPVAFPPVHRRMVVWRMWWSFVASATAAALNRRSVARRRTYAAVLWPVVVATAPLAGEDARFPGATSPAPSLDAAFVSMLDAREPSSLKHLESQMFWLLSTHPFTSAPRHHLNCYVFS